jgi:transposase-like protein
LLPTARTTRRTGGRWFVDETDVKVAARWTYLDRPLDQHGQVIDVLVSERRAGVAARACFARALTQGPSPAEVNPDPGPVYPRVIDEHSPAARHVLDHYANTTVEADHARLNARPRPMPGLNRIRSLRTVAAAHAFIQNLRRSQHAITTDVPDHDRIRIAFDELAPSP